MSYILIPELSIELHFRSNPEIALERIVSSGSQVGETHIAVRPETEEISEAFLSLDNDRVGLAIGRLLVCTSRLAKSRERIAAVVGEAAEILQGELTSPESSLSKLFGQFKDSCRVFRMGACDSQSIVTVDQNFQSTMVTSFFVDGERIVGEAELYRLENRISSAFDGLCATGRLFIAGSTRAHRSVTDEVRHLSAGTLSPKLVELFGSHSDTKFGDESVVTIARQLDDLTKKELCYNLLQGTVIELLEGSNGWRTTFTFEILNASFVPITSRFHQFWFETSQLDVEFSVTDGLGNPLEFALPKSGNNYREIFVHLPEPVGPMGRSKYAISFVTEGSDSPNYFYSVSPRTITKKLSFEVRGYPGFQFGEQRVEVEDSSGHIKDLAPEIQLRIEEVREVISWFQDNPRPGDLFRTSWVDKNFVPLKRRVLREKWKGFECVRGGAR